MSSSFEIKNPLLQKECVPKEKIVYKRQVGNKKRSYISHFFGRKQKLWSLYYVYFSPSLQALLPPTCMLFVLAYFQMKRVLSYTVEKTYHVNEIRKMRKPPLKLTIDNVVWEQN